MGGVPVPQTSNIADDAELLPWLGLHQNDELNLEHLIFDFYYHALVKFQID